MLGCDLHLGCYAHTLNIATQKALKVKTINNMLAKVRRIVAFFHRSAVAANAFKVQADLLGIPNKKLKIDDVVTRWNSAYEMIERYLEVQVAVVGALLSKDVKNKDKDIKFLQDDELRVAGDFVKCMKPLKSIITTLFTEKNASISNILPLHRRLCDQLLKSSKKDSHVVRELKATILHDLKHRYEKSYNFLLQCTFTDPRFKTLPFFDEVEKSNVHHAIITDLCK